MDRQRFEDLADAFGGDVARWPVNEQSAALTVISAQPVWAEGVLAKASHLDQALDEWRPGEVGHALREAVIAQAPAALRRARYMTWVLGVTAGLGLAGASVAGLAVGVYLAVHSSQAQIGSPDMLSPEDAVAADVSEYGA